MTLSCPLRYVLRTVRLSTSTIAGDLKKGEESRACFLFEVLGGRVIGSGLALPGFNGFRPDGTLNLDTQPQTLLLLGSFSPFLLNHPLRRRFRQRDLFRPISLLSTLLPPFFSASSISLCHFMFCVLASVGRVGRALFVCPCFLLSCLVFLVSIQPLLGTRL